MDRKENVTNKGAGGWLRIESVDFNNKELLPEVIVRNRKVYYV